MSIELVEVNLNYSVFLVVTEKGIGIRGEVVELGIDYTLKIELFIKSSC